MLFVIITTVLMGVTSGFYSANDHVETLTPANFDSKVINDDAVWIVEFYAPWCGHCKSLTPEWKKAASALKGIAKLGAVDADEHGSFAGRFGVQGFPTIKVFAGDKSKPTDYNAARTAQAIVSEALKQASSLAQSRLSGKSSGGSGSGSGSGGSKKGKQEDVIELTDSIFNKEVLDSKDMWLVEFYAPWCGHCKKLTPEWASAATTLKGKVKLGAVDATQFGELAQRYGVRGYPTIKYFPAGAKLDAEDYSGGRTADDIVAFAEAKLEQFAEPPEIKELLNDAVFQEECAAKSICVLTILPDILDTGAAGRNEYLHLLQDMGDKYKKRKFGWVWSFAGEQAGLEESLEMGGAGYPALVALNMKKSAISHMRSGFTKDLINEFLGQVVAGRGAPQPIRKDIHKLSDATPWDGKDGEMPIEEDYDLDDVDLDEMPDIKTEL